MLSTTLNSDVNWLILSAYSATLHHAYKFSVHHWWYTRSFTIIQLHLQAWATDVDFATHLAKLILSIPWLKGTLSNHEVFYVLYTFSITFQWSMPVILRYAKISRLQVLSQGESYLSILKLLTIEVLGTYSIWSISHLFMGFFYSQSHHPWLSKTG
jgi:hypothetical protein